MQVSCLAPICLWVCAFLFSFGYCVPDVADSDVQRYVFTALCFYRVSRLQHYAFTALRVDSVTCLQLNNVICSLTSAFSNTYLGIREPVLWLVGTIIVLMEPFMNSPAVPRPIPVFHTVVWPTLSGICTARELEILPPAASALACDVCLPLYCFLSGSVPPPSASLLHPLRYSHTLPTMPFSRLNSFLDISMFAVPCRA